MNFILSLVALYCLAFGEEKVPHDCPPGESPVYIYTLEQFNFHKPRTGCKSGFGVCISIGVQVDCRPSQVVYFDERTATGYGTVSEDGRTSELHLPIGLYDALRSEGEDVSTFEVGEGFEIQEPDGSHYRTVRPGVYELAFRDKEVIVTLELE
jgi:hypothetical protein